MKKRFSAALAAMMLALCLLPTAALAADNLAGHTMPTNYGTVDNNYGTVTTNEVSATVDNNYGTVTTNDGTVVHNKDGGTVVSNNNIVAMNEAGGTVGDNSDLVEENSGTVTNNKNGGTVGDNGGTVTTNEDGGVVAGNRGTVTTNNGTVTTNKAGGTVTTNNGTVTTNEAGGTVGTNASGGKVGTNGGTVGTNASGGTVNNNSGTVATNIGTVASNDSGGTVHNFGGTVTTNAAGATVYEYHKVTINGAANASVTMNTPVGGIPPVGETWVWAMDGTLALTPNAGYTVTLDSGNGTLAQSGGVYTLSSVTSAVTITVAQLSATVADVTVSGMTGTAITAKDVTITLGNGLFLDPIPVADNSWFTNLPAGLSVNSERVSDTQLRLTVSGTPTAASSQAMAITIPMGAIAGATADVVVTANSSAMWDIMLSSPAAAPPKTGDSSPLGLWLGMLLLAGGGMAWGAWGKKRAWR